MKKVNTVSKISIILIFFSSLFYMGCKKDRIQEKTLNSYDSPDSYLDSKEPEEQTFEIDSTGTGPIVGNQGTKISGTDPHSCFMYLNDTATVVYFPYTLKLVELYKPKDMIYYRMPTVASGNILKTGGEIRLRAFKNSKELAFRSNASCGMKIEMKNPAPVDGMKVFYGFTNGAGHPDWTETAGPFAKTVYGYEGITQKFGWINCDARADSSSSVTVSLASTVDELTNIRFFIYIPKTKTVMAVYNTVSENIPTGSDVKIIGIGAQGSNLFYFYDARKLTGSTTVDVEMKAISDPDLTALLDGL